MLESELSSFNLYRAHETKKKVLFVHPGTGETVYLNRDPGRRAPGLVIHPKHASLRRTLASIPDIVSEGQWYHSNNMRAFPTRANHGIKEIPYGMPFSFESLSALNLFHQELRRMTWLC